jgi:hypothetical protein
MRWLAQHIYFHRRGDQGVSYSDFEANLTKLDGTEPAATTSLFH